MIEIINDLPPHVIGFKASGKVDKDDYERILIPAVGRQSKLFKKINFILWLDTDVSNMTFGAWIDDVFVGLKHFTQFHKVAIVSHYDTIKKLTDVVSHLVPGEYMGFKIEGLEEAKNWVAS
jgi:hypothetical protein